MTSSVLPSNQAVKPASTPGRQRVRAQKERWPTRHHRKQRVGLVCWVFDWVSETGGGSGIRRKEQETQRDKGYQGLPRVTESGLPRLRSDNTESRVRKKSKFKLLNEHKLFGLMVRIEVQMHQTFIRFVILVNSHSNAQLTT